MNQILRLALAVAAIAILAACSSAAANPTGVASLGSQSRARVLESEPEASVDPEDAALAFAQCVREHGVDMPDPQVGGNGEMSFSFRADGPDGLDREQLQEAQEACQELMPTGLGKPWDVPQEQRDAMLDFAQCMREHGIDMPDPQFETGGRVMIGGPGDDGEGPKFDPRSDEFQAAQEAAATCSARCARAAAAPASRRAAARAARAPRCSHDSPWVRSGGHRAGRRRRRGRRRGLHGGFRGDARERRPGRRSAADRRS